MPYEKFDTSKIRLLPLAKREHDLDLGSFPHLQDEIPAFDHPAIDKLAAAIKQAKEKSAAIIVMIGGHVIKTGMSPYLIELMKRGYITHLGMNGACCIHDFELSMIGATTESVARYIRTGQFGLWKETGRINDIARDAQQDDIGLGEAVGRVIEQEGFPYRDVSVLAAAYRYGIPATVHVGIGQDIIHSHPNCDGAALGASSYSDFLVFARSVSNLEGGVFLNLGTAVMGPEVYLKALAMARNVAGQTGHEIRHFTTAVFDLIPLEEENYHKEADKSDYRYYFRPWKTILVRTVADGGMSYYVQADHRKTIPNLTKKVLEPDN